MVNRTYLIGGVLVVLLLAAGLAAAVFYGVGPAPGGPESGEQLTDIPPATSDGSGTGPTATALPPFSLSIIEIEDCGQTCRDVTATLQNNQDGTATGVTVSTRVFAGQDNTAEEDLVWQGKEQVGTLEAGASHTTTRRVALSLLEANKVQQNNGWITIVTTVQTDDRRVTFQDSKQVA